MIYLFHIHLTQNLSTSFDNLRFQNGFRFTVTGPNTETTEKIIIDSTTISMTIPGMGRSESTCWHREREVTVYYYVSRRDEIQKTMNWLDFLSKSVLTCLVTEDLRSGKTLNDYHLPLWESLWLVIALYWVKKRICLLSGMYNLDPTMKREEETGNWKVDTSPSRTQHLEVRTCMNYISATFIRTYVIRYI